MNMLKCNHFTWLKPVLICMDMHMGIYMESYHAHWLKTGRTGRILCQTGWTIEKQERHETDDVL